MKQERKILEFGAGSNLRVTRRIAFAGDTTYILDFFDDHWLSTHRVAGLTTDDMYRLYVLFGSLLERQYTNG